MSIAGAEFYAMIEATIRAKGLLSTMEEMGYPASGVIKLYTGNSAAKSFVSRRGIGKMRHSEIRDLWLQREVGLGNVVVLKIDGAKNPADLMTKYVKSREIKERLETMGIRIRWKRWSDHEEMLEAPRREEKG